jgi:uncharacterized protein YjbI with pentapeptide repeats
MADKMIDPYDVGALERSLNDSATRVSALWISFIFFALYMVISIGTVTQRQLLLEDPVRLPVLNVDLPVVGFFFLAPTIFVVFHAYLLLQVVLLGRTAATYNEALDRSAHFAGDNARLRQRLANTLFAQLFAGSPRERKGLVGALLTTLAWITLAIGPILVLLFFQFGFLPYHSHIVTWLHRILILVELVLIFTLWPLALHPDRDFNWLRFLKNPYAYASLAVLGFLCLTFTFPGEPHATLLSGGSSAPVDCRQDAKDWHVRLFGSFDRLSLPNVDIVDDEKIAKIEKAVADRGLKPSQGDRTRNFRGRDFNCSDFSGGDLRRSDFTKAKAVGANWTQADLQGASLDGLDGWGMNLDGAKLSHASLTAATLRQASLIRAELAGADLSRADLIGAKLERAQLQGSRLIKANLTRADLSLADFTAAALDSTTLSCVTANDAVFGGASLVEARLQGSAFRRSSFAGATLNRVSLHYSDFTDANLEATRLSNMSVWQVIGMECDRARAEGFQIIDPPLFDGTSPNQKLEEFVEVCAASQTQKDRERLAVLFSRREGFEAAFRKRWAECEAQSANRTRQELNAQQIAVLLGLACSALPAVQADIIKGLVRIWTAPPLPVDLDTPEAYAEYYKALGRAIIEGSSCRLPSLLDARELAVARALAANGELPPALWRALP